jgi:hypothetical protein
VVQGGERRGGEKENEFMWKVCATKHSQVDYSVSCWMRARIRKVPFSPPGYLITNPSNHIVPVSNLLDTAEEIYTTIG